MAQEKEERIARLESTNRDLRQQLQVVGYEPAETMERPRDEEEGTLKRRRKRKRRNRRKQPEHSKRNKNESCSTTETELDDEKGVAAPPLLVKQEVVEETTTTTCESAGTHVEVDQAQRENDEVLEARLEPKEKEKDELCVEEKQQGQEQQADQEAQVAGEASEVVRMLQDMFPGTSAQVIEHTLGEVAGSTEKAIDCLLNLCTALDLTRAESKGARPNIAPSSAAPTSTSTSTSSSSSSFTTPSISSTRSAHVSSPSRQSPRPVPSFSSSSSSSSSSSAPITYTRASSSVLGEPDEDAGVTCLSEQQQRALDLAERGYSMFLTGSAGTGKSFLLRQMIERLRLKHGPEAVAVTASTGVAAINIDGMTLHKWAGVGLGNEGIKVMLGRAFGKRKEYKQMRVLIIDEISMIKSDLFDQLEYIARRVRNWKKVPAKEKPFGGIQLICCGDFFQLPPVLDKTNKRMSMSQAFAFNAESWQSCVDVVVQLSKVFRQKDERFQGILNEIRQGACSDESRRILNECVGRRFEDDLDILPTKLHPTNQQVDAINQTHMDELDGDSCQYLAKDKLPAATGPRKILTQWLHQSCSALEALELKEAAQVMLIRNLTSKLVNGSRGVVLGWATADEFEDILIQTKYKHEKGVDVQDSPYRPTLHESVEQAKWLKKQSKNPDFRLPLVRFIGHEQPIIVGPVVFTGRHREKGEVHECSRCQIPLKLAWAVTIHKCQGLSLDRVEISLASVFAPGQAYVALSRVRSLDGLCLLSPVDRRHAFVTPTVVDFYRRYVREQAERESNGTHLAPRTLPKCQMACAKRVPAFLQQDYCDDRGITSAPLSGVSADEMEAEILASAQSAAALASPRRYNPASASQRDSQGGRRQWRNSSGQARLSDREGDDGRPRYFRHNSLGAMDFRAARGGAVSTQRGGADDYDEEFLRALAESQSEPSPSSQSQPLFWFEK